jgi:hypothetical protein
VRQTFENYDSKPVETVEIYCLRKKKPKTGKQECLEGKPLEGGLSPQRTVTTRELHHACEEKVFSRAGVTQTTSLATRSVTLRYLPHPPCLVPYRCGPWPTGTSRCVCPSNTNLTNLGPKKKKVRVVGIGHPRRGSQHFVSTSLC